jgi:ABC-type transport system involved in multi-copper enzyme maturation permease subunit
LRLAIYFIGHEVRVQLRSARFRIAAALYLAACTAPACVVYLYQRQTATLLGAATYAGEVLTVLPAASAVLALVVASDGILRERGAGMWIPLTTMPLGNAGYLLRRWLALAVLLVALSLLPLAGAVLLAAAAGAPPLVASNLIAPWTLQVLPASLAASALSLGMCTIADGIVAGAVQGLMVLLLVPAILNRVLALAGRHIASPASWLGVDRVVLQAEVYLAALRGWGRPLRAASEGGYDATAAAGHWASTASLTVALAFAALALSASFLRRSRRDLRPWRIGAGHPLRGLLGLANRIRGRYTPDSLPGVGDRLLLVGGVAILAAAMGTFWARDSRYRALALRRYEVETGAWPAPTAGDLVPTRWTLHARLKEDGQARSLVTAGLRNTGAVPRAAAAFSLDPGLTVLGVGVDRGGASAERRWDRLEVRLSPPLAAGEERRLTFDLAGRPARLQFELPAPGLAFFARWEYLRSRRLAHDLTDLSASYPIACVSPRRIELAAADLLPVPRYTSWALAPRADAAALVPRESLLREVDLSLDLTAPAGVFLADSCGDSARPGRALHGRCRTTLNDLAVRGARADTDSAGDPDHPAALPGQGPRFALLPQHRALAAPYAAALRSLALGLPRAWPGIARGGASAGGAPPAIPVLLEWSPPFSLEVDPDVVRWELSGPEDGPAGRADNAKVAGRAGVQAWDALEAQGALVLVAERLVARSAPLPSNQIVAAVVTNALLRRRVVVENQRFVIGALVRALVEHRLGLGPPNGAVVVANHYDAFFLHLALLDAQLWGSPQWIERLDALAADLWGRVGEGALAQGLDTFLARPGGSGGTLAELLQDLAAAGTTSLTAFYRDYCAGSALPELSLADVRERRGDGAWEVTGAVENRGTGEAICPVVLNTSLGASEIAVRVPDRGTARFTLHAANPPQSVQLDPRQACHRLRPTVGGAIVEYVSFREAGP